MGFNFFASEGDLVDLLRWIDGTGDFRFIEVDSKPDQPNRVFDKFPEDIWRTEGKLDFVNIWPHKAGAEPFPRWVEFTPEARAKMSAKGRWVLESPAILQFYRMKLTNPSSIGPLEFRYATEKLVERDARFTQNQIDRLNWPELNAAITAIKKRIRSTAGGKWKSMPVMKEVSETLIQGDKRLWYWGDEGTI